MLSLHTRLLKQVEVMRATAAAGDPAYRAMLLGGQDRMLEVARQGLMTFDRPNMPRPVRDRADDGPMVGCSVMADGRAFR